MSLQRFLREGKFRAALLFLPNFAAAKVCIYLIPISIAATTSGQIYGAIELSLAVGPLIAAVAVGGPLAGITQSYLIRGRTDITDQLWMLNLAGCVISLFAAAMAWVADVRLDFVCALAVIGVAVTHSCASSAARMFGKRNLTAWADGTAILVAAVAVGLMTIIPEKQSLKVLILIYVSLVAISAFVSLIGLTITLKSRISARLLETLSIGLPMALFGLVSMWLGVGGRITVGALLPSYLPAYALAFRITGLTLGVHQVLQTAFFAKLYKAKTRSADRLISPFLAGACGLALVISFSGEFIVEQLQVKSIDPNGLDAFRILLPVVAIHVFFWIATAMLQARINRSRLSKRAIFPVLIVTLAGAATMVVTVYFELVSVVGLTWLIAIQAAFYFLTSWLILARKGLFHYRIGMIGLLGGILLSLNALL